MEENGQINLKSVDSEFNLLYSVVCSNLFFQLIL